MNQIEQFRLLLKYADPRILIENGELEVVALLNKIEKASREQNAVELDRGVGEFFRTLTKDSLRGYAPATPTLSREQFNEVTNATLEALEKIEKIQSSDQAGAKPSKAGRGKVKDAKT